MSVALRGALPAGNAASFAQSARVRCGPPVSNLRLPASLIAMNQPKKPAQPAPKTTTPPPASGKPATNPAPKPGAKPGAPNKK